jgi:hypothetical protein
VKRVLILAAALLTAGCATNSREPVVTVKTVGLPVAVSCVPPSLGPAPSYPDTDESLRSAGPERFLQLVLAGRDLRDARLAQVEPVLDGCRQGATPR